MVYVYLSYLEYSVDYIVNFNEILMISENILYVVLSSLKS